MNDKPIKVLLAAGDADETAVLARLLEDGAGVGDAPGRFEVKAAPRLTSASHLLAREEFDAVLLDIMLPRGVGLEAFRKIRAQRPDVPVLILAGLRDRALAEDAVRQGAQDYVVKGTLGACLLRRSLRHAIERQRLASELERLRRDRGAGAESRERLMCKVSHELRNTATTVKAAVYCLSDGLPDSLAPKQRQLVEMIARNVDRQVKIMDDVLDLSRLRAGRRPARLRPMDLAALADELAREAALRGAPRPLELDLSWRLPPVQGDPDLLALALRRLLDNAFRHAAGKVTLRAAPDGADGVALCVADDGPGIPPGRMDGLFADGDLGLAICREVVAAHGGRIWAENGAPGARFHVRLPRADARSQAVQQGVTVPPLDGPGGGPIIIESKEE